jgi:hypothetical protein
MEDVGKVYGHLVYFMAIWHISRPVGIFYGHLVCFPHFGKVVARKNWQPGARSGLCNSPVCHFSQEKNDGFFFPQPRQNFSSRIRQRHNYIL